MNRLFLGLIAVMLAAFTVQGAKTKLLIAYTGASQGAYGPCG